MVLSDFSIRRPVVAIVFSLLLVVFGLFALGQMQVRETPNIDRPFVSVHVSYVGASAEVVETRMLKVIEDQISGISGIKSIRSFGKDGFGNVDIEFVEGKNIDEAANDVRDQVSRVINRLPEDADTPIIEKADPDDDPIVWISLWSTQRSALELTDYATLVLGPQISTLNGISSIAYGGQRKKAMRIWLDRRAMAARELTSADVESALRRENVELGAGMIESRDRFITMRTIRPYQSPAEFEKLVISRGPNNLLIRLGDIAKVELGPVDGYGTYRNNGQPGVGLGVKKQPGASTLDVARDVIAEVERLQKSKPADITMVVSQDNSQFIAAAIKEVSIAGVVAAALVMAVIYLFLGTVRAAIIPAVTVPISIIATALVMWPAGFSINILTLLAMVLAIGLVVDDAIIMLENIHRRMRAGEPVLLAAIRGSRQVGMAIVSTTLVLAAAFMPIALLRGNVGALFREFAVTMAVAVLVSMVVSLTLTPVMCSKILNSSLDDSRAAHAAERAFERLKLFYARWLNKSLDKPAAVLIGFAVTIVLTGVFFVVLPKEFTPREDRGQFQVQIKPPEGASPEYVERQVKAAYDVIKPEIDSGVIVRAMEVVNGPGNGGNILVNMTPWKNRDITAPEYAAKITPAISQITGAQIAVNLPQGMGRGGGGGGGGLNLTIGGPSYEELRKWRDALMADLGKNPKFVQVRNNFVETKPQMRVKIDTVRAGDLGVSVQTIGQTLASMLGSRKVTTFVDGGEEYDVILQNQLDDRRTPTDISNIYVRSDTTRELIPLSSVVTLEEAAYSNGLNRFNRRRAISVNIFPRLDIPLGELIEEVEKVVKARLPETAELNWRGEAGDYRENSAAIYFSFALALVVVFLVLAAQFESFIHPVVVMMTVPLATAGALLGLTLFGQTINLYSQIGIIVLVGLAAKNGILIVEFANQLRDQGREFREALVEAALTRFRPIIMTMLATVMGAVPLLIATGAGAEARRPIGVVVFAGVSCAALITLLVIPTFYMLLARRTKSPGFLAAEIRKQEASYGDNVKANQPAE